MTFLESGNVEPMLEAARAQLNIVREENEWFLDDNRDMSMPPLAMAIDDHVLHQKEHASLLSTLQARNAPFALLVLAHIQQHESALVNAQVQMKQVQLGYDIPLPAMTGAPGMPTMGGMPQQGGPPQASEQDDGNEGPGRSAVSRTGDIGKGPSQPEMPKMPVAQTASGAMSTGGIAA
jgi:hypothetical protein